MPVFGMPDRRERETETPFDVPQEMAAAMRLMVQPAAGMIAMSAIGFGMASQALGLWFGAATGVMQATQRLFVPLDIGPSAVPDAPAVPKREKPTLKVVAQNEPDLRVAAKPAPAKPAAAIAETALATPVAKAAEPVAAKPAARTAETEPTKAAAERAAAKPAASGTRAKAAPKAKVEPIAQPAARGASAQPGGLSKPRAIERPAAPDDLKAISGIGPKLEKVLNDLGVWTYAQVAAWEKQEVAWVDDYLSFKGRIDRDGWIEQARALATTKGE